MSSSLSNPYLSTFCQLGCVREFRALSLHDDGSASNAWRLKLAAEKARHKLVELYAYSIPTAEAIRCIAKHSPAGVVEIGAGLGYWASMMRQAEINVVAYDIEPDPKENWYFAKSPEAESWTYVYRGTADQVDRHELHSLFLCWPEPDFALEALTKYGGKCLIFAGELNTCNLCGGYREFLAAVNEGWTLVDQVDLPNWPGCTDKLYVYHRNQ